MTPNLPQTLETTNAALLSHVRPIVKAYLALEDVHHMGGAWLDADDERRAAKRVGDKSTEWIAHAKANNYSEAKGYIDKARNQLWDMIVGIRDNYISDASVNPNHDAADDEIDAAEAFNDELARGVMSVEWLIKMVEDEA